MENTEDFKQEPWIERDSSEFIRDQMKHYYSCDSEQLEKMKED